MMPQSMWTENTDNTRLEKKKWKTKPFCILQTDTNLQGAILVPKWKIRPSLGNLFEPKNVCLK